MARRSSSRTRCRCWPRSTTPTSPGGLHSTVTALHGNDTPGRGRTAASTGRPEMLGMSSCCPRAVSSTVCRQAAGRVRDGGRAVHHDGVPGRRHPGRPAVSGHAECINNCWQLVPVCMYCIHRAEDCAGLRHVTGKAASLLMAAAKVPVFVESRALLGIGRTAPIVPDSASDAGAAPRNWPPRGG